MSLANRQDSYRKGYVAGLDGKKLSNPYKLRERNAAFERGYFAGTHGRYLVNAAVRAESQLAEHDRTNCDACARASLWRTTLCRDVRDLMADAVSTYAALSPLDRAAFGAWQSHYYATSEQAPDLDLMEAFA